eukprot:TRINITY_DN351_c0_g1_i2.p1 TRINITY_DN351_c0_g1~~TRINITY_DN351_c0_g1_i2.p1  ORF type:complete len:670 (-),score=108.92 TRINITY_DN351_c0_g1_i2:39-2048(-)
MAAIRRSFALCFFGHASLPCLAGRVFVFDENDANSTDPFNPPVKYPIGDDNSGEGTDYHFVEGYDVHSFGDNEEALARFPTRPSNVDNIEISHEYTFSNEDSGYDVRFVGGSEGPLARFQGLPKDDDDIDSAIPKGNDVRSVGGSKGLVRVQGLPKDDDDTDSAIPKSDMSSNGDSDYDSAASQNQAIDDTSEYHSDDTSSGKDKGYDSEGYDSEGYDSGASDDTNEYRSDEMSSKKNEDYGDSDWFTSSSSSSSDGYEIVVDKYQPTAKTEYYVKGSSHDSYLIDDLGYDSAASQKRRESGSEYKTPLANDDTSEYHSDDKSSGKDKASNTTIEDYDGSSSKDNQPSKASAREDYESSSSTQAYEREISGLRKGSSGDYGKSTGSDTTESSSSEGISSEENSSEKSSAPRGPPRARFVNEGKTREVGTSAQMGKTREAGTSAHTGKTREAGTSAQLVTCGGFECLARRTPKPEGDKVVCATSSCTDSDCCMNLDQVTCAGFVCTAKSIPDAGHMNALTLGVICKGSNCTEDECCLSKDKKEAPSTRSELKPQPVVEAVDQKLLKQNGVVPLNKTNISKLAAKLNASLKVNSKSIKVNKTSAGKTIPAETGVATKAGKTDVDDKEAGAAPRKKTHANTEIPKQEIAVPSPVIVAERAIGEVQQVMPPAM